MFLTKLLQFLPINWARFFHFVLSSIAYLLHQATKMFLVCLDLHWPIDRLNAPLLHLLVKIAAEGRWLERFLSTL